jgi:hypothetical protein
MHSITIPNASPPQLSFVLPYLYNKTILSGATTLLGQLDPEDGDSKLL